MPEAPRLLAQEVNLPREARMCFGMATHALCIRVRPCNRLRQLPRLWMTVSVAFFAMSEMMTLDSAPGDNHAKLQRP